MGHIENGMLATYNEAGPIDERRVLVTKRKRERDLLFRIPLPLHGRGPIFEKQDITNLAFRIDQDTA